MRLTFIWTPAYKAPLRLFGTQDHDTDRIKDVDLSRFSTLPVGFPLHKNLAIVALTSKHLNADSMNTSKLSQKPSTGFTATGQVPLILFHFST